MVQLLHLCCGKCTIMLHLLQQGAKVMFEQEDYERYGIYDLSDVLSDDDIEEIRQKHEADHYHSPVSMDSLGLSWRDFF